MCTKEPKTVDYELATRTGYLDELKASLKRFDGSMTQTMNAFRELLASFDNVAQVYGNVAGSFGTDAREPILAVREAMRNLKDKGPFGAFNNDLHAGTISVLDPIKQELKQTEKALSEVRASQKEYDAARVKIAKTEQAYAKKGKPLSEKKGYNKDIEKRDKYKATSEQKRRVFEHGVDALKAHVESTFALSLNNYLHAVASMCGMLETTLNAQRTDTQGGGGNVLAPRNAVDALKADAIATQQSHASYSHRASSSNNNNNNSRAATSSGGGGSASKRDNKRGDDAPAALYAADKPATS